MNEQNEQMENKYTINVVFQQPFFIQETNQIDFTNKSATFAYDNFESAKQSYDSFNQKRFVEIETEMGSATFNLLLVELITPTVLQQEENKEEENNDTKTNKLETKPKS